MCVRFGDLWQAAFIVEEHGLCPVQLLAPRLVREEWRLLSRGHLEQDAALLDGFAVLQGVCEPSRLEEECHADASEDGVARHRVFGESAEGDLHGVGVERMREHWHDIQE